LQRDKQIVADLKAVFPAKDQDELVKSALAGAAGVQDATPIFVVGLPRSGSTLIEQILASHPQAYGAGRSAFRIPSTQPSTRKCFKGNS
jgi:hypothetical protein